MKSNMASELKVINDVLGCLISHPTYNFSRLLRS